MTRSAVLIGFAVIVILFMCLVVWGLVRPEPGPPQVVWVCTTQPGPSVTAISLEPDGAPLYWVYSFFNANDRLVGIGLIEAVDWLDRVRRDRNGRRAGWQGLRMTAGGGAGTLTC